MRNSVLMHYSHKTTDSLDMYSASMEIKWLGEPLFTQVQEAGALITTQQNSISLYMPV